MVEYASSLGVLMRWNIFVILVSIIVAAGQFSAAHPNLRPVHSKGDSAHDSDNGSVVILDSVMASSTPEPRIAIGFEGGLGDEFEPVLYHAQALGSDRFLIIVRCWSICSLTDLVGDRESLSLDFQRAGSDSMRGAFIFDNLNWTVEPTIDLFGDWPFASYFNTKEDALVISTYCRYEPPPALKDSSDPDRNATTRCAGFTWEAEPALETTSVTFNASSDSIEVLYLRSNIGALHLVRDISTQNGRFMLVNIDRFDLNPRQEANEFLTIEVLNESLQVISTHSSEVM